jgi:hypothetical protein
MEIPIRMKNPIFTDSELYLELDYENIPIREYNAILIILNSCPSLVNEDILQISSEIIKRMEMREITANSKNIDTVRRLYYLLQNIPETNDLQLQIRHYYGAFIKSPVASPVTPPKIMPKPRKSSTQSRERYCPC